MTSSLTWLDYSERDRRRAVDVIDLFRESGTVDELGVASVRNSFSDLFFPDQHGPDSGVLPPARTVDLPAAGTPEGLVRQGRGEGSTGGTQPQQEDAGEGTTVGACSGSEPERL